MNITKVVFAVDSTQVKAAKKDMDALQQSGEKTEKTTEGLGRSIRSLAAAVAVGLSTSAIVSYTDRWTDLNARLRNVTGSAEASDIALDRISQTARRTYSSLEQTADTFTRNAVTLTELGYSTARQLDLMESLNNALVISGTKGQVAESVLNALSKAFAFGELRGENFNTVIQQGGRIVEALAAGLGVTTLELRKMAEQGDLKTKPVIEAITSQMEKLSLEAEAMPATIGDGFLLLNNAMFEFVGRMDDAIGASSAVSSVMVTLADNIDDVAAVVGITGVAMAGQYVAGAIAAGTATASLTAAATALRTALLMLAGPAGIITAAGVALYALVQHQKASAEAAWEQATAFDEVRAKLAALTASELARAVQKEFEHVNALKEKVRRLTESRDAAMRAGQATGAYEDKLRKANLELEAAESNHQLLVRQLQRVREEGGKTTAQVIEQTAAVSALDNAYAMEAIRVNNTAENYIRLMGIQDEVITRTSRLSDVTRTATLDAETFDLVLSGTTATVGELTAATEQQSAATEAMSQVTNMMRDDISSAFADMMMNGENAFDAIAKSFERMLYKMVADWAASGVMNAVGSLFGMGGAGGTSVLGSILGGGGSAGGGGTSAGGILSGLGGALKAGGGKLISGAASAGSSIMSGLGAAGSSLMSGAAALATNPITWAVLGAAALGKALDKGGTPTSAAGISFTAPANERAKGRIQDVAPFASGVAPVMFMKRSDWEVAQQIEQAFRQADAGVVEAFRQAGFEFPSAAAAVRGLGTDFNGKNQGDFLGMAREKGFEGPALDKQLNEYVARLIEHGIQANGGLGMDAASIRNAGTAEGMIMALQAALDSPDGSHAGGLDYVPYDGYRASVHRGEAIITAHGNEALGQMAVVLMEIKNALIGGGATLSTAAEQFAQSVSQFGRMSEVTG